MAGDWTVRGYRVNKAKLWGVVGSRKTSLAKPIVAAAKSAGLARDRRIKVPLEQLVDEILSGELERSHAAAYRILLGPVADVIQKRLALKGCTELVSHAPRDRVGRALATLGMTGFAKGWKKAYCPWPWLGREPKVTWPLAALWSPAEVSFNMKEAAGVASFELPGDAHGELAAVARTLGGLAKAAHGQSLIILADDAP